MFAGTLGRGQFFVKSGLLATAEAAVLAVCIAIQHEAFFGPPGEGRYRLAASVLLASIPFGYQRISLAIRRNRDAGGGQAVAGIYAIATCVALALQIQALISRASDDPINGMEQPGRSTSCWAGSGSICSSLHPPRSNFATKPMLRAAAAEAMRPRRRMPAPPCHRRWSRRSPAANRSPLRLSRHSRRASSARSQPLYRVGGRSSADAA
ncbi:MAG: hypothetical protein ACTHP8_11245 [Bosea sp. (in: a-proteobacteria)]|uniref:hypothetical protein n=1 Tax=Bosea sp. (in: a-proteobacteria) TaxID=1871050 RepID=UPI003F7C0795